MVRPRSMSLCLLLPLVASGCLSSMRSKPATTVPMTDSSSSAEATDPPCAATGAADDGRIATLEAERERRQVELIEARGEAARLRAQLDERQTLLDAAIREVVRARAKQRSTESRAQAATEIAEAEVALERLVGAAKRSAEAREARQLLEAAGHEFDAENFGGALYLATQSKGRIRLAGSGPAIDADSAASRVADERPFDAPVVLAALRRSNVRRGPGTEFRVLRTIEPGTRLTGHAAKGAWIRTTGEDGRGGWIHGSLVEGAPR